MEQKRLPLDDLKKLYPAAQIDVCQNDNSGYIEKGLWIQEKSSMNAMEDYEDWQRIHREVETMALKRPQIRKEIANWQQDVLTGKWEQPRDERIIYGLRQILKRHRINEQTRRRRLRKRRLETLLMYK